MKTYIGIDVGTGSARAGIFDEIGTLLAVAKHDISMARPQTGWAEQSTENIWHAVCASVKSALLLSSVNPLDVIAIGFDATCSLVLADKSFSALSLADDESRDVMVWMDQRAVDEAKICSTTNAMPLRYVGGTMSPEMQIPKLLWLKRNRPEIWSQLGYAGDLSDWLTCKATGNNARSVCTLTCKWGFMPHQSPSWDSDFLAQIGLDDVLEKANLPAHAVSVGKSIGTLNARAATELGLHERCLVSAGMIDAHAGAVLSFSLLKPHEIPTTLGLVAGTSNCHMAMNRRPVNVPGVWGPYYGVVNDDYWLNEGGQTTTGALFEHLIATYRGADAYLPNVHEQVSEALLADYSIGNDPAPHQHVLPDFLGNRSPYADPSIRGIISGLDFSSPEDIFKHIYWASACAIAYGTRAIMECMHKYGSEQGYDFTRIVLTGGHANSLLLTRLYADATGCEIILPQTDEPVLLGSAMTAFAAANNGNMNKIKDMVPEFDIHSPCGDMKALHDKRYECFTMLYRHHNELLS